MIGNCVKIPRKIYRDVFTLSINWMAFAVVFSNDGTAPEADGFVFGGVLASI